MAEANAFERRNRILDECQRSVKAANRRAVVLRAVSGIANALIIVMGLGVGFAGVLGGVVPSAQEGALYAVTFLGFGVSALKGLIAGCNVEEKAVVNKQRAIALKALARRLHQGIETGAELERTLARAEEELDRMELDSFGGASPVQKRNIAGPDVGHFGPNGMFRAAQFQPGV